MKKILVLGAFLAVSGCALNFSEPTAAVTVSLGGGARAISASQLYFGNGEILEIRIEDLQGTVIASKTYSDLASNYFLEADLEIGTFYRMTAAFGFYSGSIWNMDSRLIRIAVDNQNIGLTLGHLLSGLSSGQFSGFDPKVFQYSWTASNPSDSLVFATSNAATLSHYEYSFNGSPWVSNQYETPIDLNFAQTDNVLRVQYLQESGEWAVYTFNITYAP